MEKGQGRRPKTTHIEIREMSPAAIWRGIVVELTRLADARNKPVNTFAPIHQFGIFPETEPNRTIRVNCAFAENGKPTVVVIDASYKKAHTQQLVLRAKWVGDEPQKVDIDPSKIPGAKSILPPEVVGAYALHMLGEMRQRALDQKAQQEQEEQERQPEHEPQQPTETPFVMFMPESYGEGNN